MKYRAEFDEAKSQFQVHAFEDDGTQAGYLGSAPDKEAAKALVREHVRMRKEAKKAIEFDDDGKITKDETVKAATQR